MIIFVAFEYLMFRSIAVDLFDWRRKSFVDLEVKFVEFVVGPGIA
jgi:hypothetical protein